MCKIIVVDRHDFTNVIATYYFATRQLAIVGRIAAMEEHCTPGASKRVVSGIIG